MRKAEILRKLFQEKDLIRIVGAHNGLSAKLVEMNGFDGIWASGLEVATSHAVPDANILTMTDFLNACISMNEATSIPIVADCDTGYGNSNNVIHMVKKFEAAGIAAVCIEDKQFPKVNSFIAGRQELASISEFVGKIMAAKNAQESEEFMVIARVEALIAGLGMDEALKRAHTYVDAGADAILIHSKMKVADEIIEFAKKWNKKAPLVIVPTKYPAFSEAEMKLANIKMTIYANHGIRAMIKNAEDVLGEIARNGIVGIESGIAPMEKVFEIQGMYRMKENEKKYLKTAEDARVIIPAAGDPSKEPSFNDILRDTPITMLDINGKPILQRAVEVLNSAGLQDIIAISGFEEGKIKVDGVKTIHNPEYGSKGIMHSIMKAEDKLDQKTLIVYSDILFEKDIITKLLQRDDDIVLVLDRTISERKNIKKHMDLVQAKYNPITGGRVMAVITDNPIVKIGKNVSPEKANYEFAGIALFSKKGISLLKDTYKNALNRYNNEKFHESPSVERASFTDIMQEMIDNNIKISTLEIGGGWAEIRNFEDYKRTSNMFAQGK